MKRVSKLPTATSLCFARLARPTFLSVLLLLLALNPGHRAHADEPGVFTKYTSTFQVSASPSQYDVIQQVLDFAPGAATREHSHGGTAYVTVLEGQVTRKEGSNEVTYRPGQTFIEARGVQHMVTNKGNIKARVLASFLLSPGGPQTLNILDGPAPATAAVAAFLARVTVGTQPDEFTLTQSVFDMEPGASVPLHAHDGLGFVMVLDGEVSFATGGAEAKRSAGGTFIDSAPSDRQGAELATDRGRTAVALGDTARNSGSKPASVVATYLVHNTRTQAPSLPIVGAGGLAPAIRPPATGNGGLSWQNSD
jgi:quercetin dioxygenase-like cupin family protein